MAEQNQTSSLPDSVPLDIFQQALAHHRQGHLLRAAALYQQLLEKIPAHADALHRLGQVHIQSGRLEPAADLLERSIQTRPGNAAAHSDLGVVQQALEQHELALASFRSAVQLDPSQAQAWSNLGNCLQQAQQFERALVCYDNALKLQPKFAEACYNRGNLLQSMARHEEAIASYERAIRLQPDYPEVLSNRSTSLIALKHHDQALASCDAALRLRPGFVDAVNNRARALQKLERLDEAAATFAYLLQLQPDHAYARSKLLHLHLKSCDWSDYHQGVEHITNAVTAGKGVESPFNFLSICDSAMLQQQCAQARIAIRFPDSGKRLWQELGRDEAAAITGKIKIAYLSSDFRNHPMASLISELLELHDRSRFEIIGICYGPNDGSRARKRIEAALDYCIDVDALDDGQAARVLCELDIDIAVDLNGLTSHSRTGILALRPAPVQVNYMGFPGTMGTTYIDYILADGHLIPPDQHQYYSEKVVALPDSYQVNDRQRRIADWTPTRAEFGLPETGFVFCCFNNNSKISPVIFDVWMQLLNETEGSVLWLHQNNAEVPDNLRREARDRGVDPTRLVFKSSLPMPEHLSAYRRADLFLDTLPFNAHTTASDALWAGLPVLTCMGNSFAGRVAGSLLHAAGLPELITHSLPEYQAMALHLAREPQQLAALKHKLARNRDACALFDTPRFCRHIEAAYTMMWRRHLRGEAPAPIAVPVIEVPDIGAGPD